MRIHEGFFLRTSAGATWTEIPFLCEREIGSNWSIGPFHVLSFKWGAVGYHEPFAVLKGSGQHLIAYCHYETSINFLPELISESGEYSLMDWVYPNGYQAGVAREIPPEILEG